MAIFGSKKNEVKKVEAQTPKVVAKVQHKNIDRISAIIRPRVTEKASLMNEQNAHVFNVATSANKKDVMIAIRELYKVTPIRVNMVSVKSKSVVVRGKYGTKGGGKKAYVFLKKGDVIDLA